MELLNILNSRAFDSLHVPDGWKVDYQGWICDQFSHVFRKCLDEKTETVDIIEVGVWKGLSTQCMIRECIQKNLKPRIIAIDTWLGAPEFWNTSGKYPERDLMFVDGYPQVFYTFTRNIKSEGYSEYVFPFPISSVQGAHVLKQHGLTADVIYIDASHEYDAVKSDIHAYWDLLKPGGVMIGDDYDWPGVKKAVDEFQHDASVDGRIWSIVKKKSS